jgi:hypothetical protein
MRLSRKCWWALGLLSGCNLEANAWTFEHYRAHWHPDVAVLSLVCIGLAAGVLRRGRDRA